MKGGLVKYSDVVFLIILFVALLLASGCYSAPRALIDLVVVQDGVLARYVDQANPKLSEDWQEVGTKLVRNQKTILDLVKGEK